MMRLLASLTIFGALLVAQRTVPDEQIFDAVRLRLASDHEVKGGRLEVTVEKGVVTIRGKVEKEKYKQKAERLASKVQGVKKVVNELKVDPTT
jgi:osmotically-inducible protein OsmY